MENNQKEAGRGVYYAIYLSTPLSAVMSHSRPSPMSRTKTTQIIAQLKLRGMTVCQSAGTGIRIAIEWQIQLGLTASMLAGGMTIKQSPPIKTPLPFSYPPLPLMEPDTDSNYPMGAEKPV